MNFDSLTVSELRAICAELNIVVGDSARKTEYVEALDLFFQAENVDETLMVLTRDNLQKVARRLSLSHSGTKRELVERILEAVNPASAVNADPEDRAESEDNPVVKAAKKTPWYVWALVIASIALFWFVSQQAQKPVDVDALAESVSMSVGETLSDIEGSLQDLSNRVGDLEVGESTVAVPDPTETPIPQSEDPDGNGEVSEKPTDEESVEESSKPITQTLSAGANPPEVVVWLSALETIPPAEEPFEWKWQEVQKGVSEWSKCPFPGQWCRYAGRPATWIVVDASGVRVSDGGFDGPNVTITKVEATETQKDVYITDGQIFVYPLSVEEADILDFAKYLASHTGASNRQTISIVKAY